MAYVAVCNLTSQATTAILDIQAGTLIPSPAQVNPQSWQLWTPGMEGSSDFVFLVR